MSIFTVWFFYSCKGTWVLHPPTPKWLELVTFRQTSLEFSRSVIFINQHFLLSPSLVSPCLLQLLIIDGQFPPTTVTSCLSNGNWVDPHTHTHTHIVRCSCSWGSVDPLRDERRKEPLRRFFRLRPVLVEEEKKKGQGAEVGDEEEGEKRGETRAFKIWQEEERWLLGRQTGGGREEEEDRKRGE